MVPFLIDFSSFKPQIQAVVADAVNAKVDFKSARLHILPSVGIKLSDVTIENTDPTFSGTKLFTVDELKVHTAILPLLSGKIVGQISIVEPEIQIAKKGIKTNIAALAKPAKPTQPPPPAENKPSAPTQSEQENTFKTIKEKVLIESIVINKAKVTISELPAADLKGAAPNAPVKITDLNIKILNIGLERDIDISISTNLDVKESGAKVKGPIQLNQKVRVAFGANGLENAAFSGKISLDELHIEYLNAFNKKPSIPLNLTYEGSMVPSDFILKSMTFNFHNLKLDAQAHIVDFNDPRINASLKVSNDNLASLGDVLPQHRDMLINGQLDVDAGVDGKVSSLDSLHANLKLDLKLTGSDLKVDLASTGLVPFKGKLAVDSKNLDLDALMKPFSKPEGTQEATKETPPTPAPEGQTTAAGKPAESVQPAKDFELSKEQKAMLQGTDADVQVALKSVALSSTKLTNIIVSLNQKNLLSSLSRFNIDGFGGSIAASGQGNLEKSPISFRGEFKMQNIQPEQIMAVIKPEHKNLLVGRMNLSLNVDGSGTTVPTLNKTLNGKGSFKFLEGQLNTPSIAQKMQEQFEQYVEKLSISGAGEGIISAAKKLLDNPLAKAAGKSPPDIDKIKDQYKTLAGVKLASKSSVSKDIKDLSGNIEIKEGKIHLTTSKIDESGSMDIKSFVNLELGLGGGAVYTASAAVKQSLLNQSKYADLLMDDNNNLILNMGLGGTVTDPKVSLSSDSMKASFQKKAQALVEKEVKVAAQNYINGLLGKNTAVDAAKDEAKARAEAESRKRSEEAKAKAAEEAKKHEGKAKDALKGLFGK
jgi:hypothetical protein